ncbi:glycine cleavage system protein H [Anaeromyxobacter sp. Fw109-5]|uniref:glycine cleavage system protein H n=1 Tax=Anaeromyxobacter sp. (strain Fw109-5) TaxID=404589 RepID=UPI0000ED82DE|nr:glycine cleavage system protein H [Anaeromyxobacter sp. Fw109-5]ABS26005.1 glycine cleavage H-protein [Anaeromyxobacter sp. Fw109-5]
MAHDFLSIYPAKLLEYALAVGYLLLFIPFWRYVQGGRLKEATVRVAAPRPVARAAAAVAAGARALRPTAGWFQLPAGVHLHPGHTWARLEDDGLVAVGVDDFAHKLVGPARVELPAVGAIVAQGEPALAMGDQARTVPLLSPIDGTVVAVNAKIRDGKEPLEDPYGAGWLFKVKAPRLAANLRQLLTDGPARHFVEDAGERLALRMSPELAHVLQDGGAPIHGIAHALAGDDWERLAREHFLT